jgi:dTDP-4-dehydrorhamnose reductase
VRRLAPALVIHTAYRKGEQAVLDRDVVGASAAVAVACRAAGTALLHLSSDVVFDGEHAPYAETAPLAPVDAYGQAKAAAERRVVTAVPDAALVRTSLVVRADPPDPASAALLAGVRAGTPMRLYTDELRMPIGVGDLSAAIWHLGGLPRRERSGPWHLVGAEALSRHALGLLILRRHGLPGDFPTAPCAVHPSPRPRDLRLITARADALGVCPRGVSAVLAPPT